MSRKQGSRIVPLELAAEIYSRVQAGESESAVKKEYADYFDVTYEAICNKYRRWLNSPRRNTGQYPVLASENKEKVDEGFASDEVDLTEIFTDLEWKSLKKGTVHLALASTKAIDGHKLTIVGLPDQVLKMLRAIAAEMEW